MTKIEKFPPVHPGKTLERQFFQPLQLTREKLAWNLCLPLYQLEDLIAGKSNINPEIAWRLSNYFKIEPEVFLNLQQHYDLEVWKDKQEFQVKQKVVEKTKNSKLNKDKKKFINELLKQANKSENLNWESFYNYWENNNWSKSHIISNTQKISPKK
jgi:addiction module HigA family antidote